MNTHSVPTLRLKKREERRILAGHQWVFSNEIDTAVTPLKGLIPGSPVAIASAAGKFLAHGYVNPHSLISVRITSWKKFFPFSKELLRQRLVDALALREKRFSQPYYRLVHGEGDFLGGLVVDRFDDVLVMQVTTAGMDAFEADLLEILQELLPVNAIQLVNDTRMRELEQLPLVRRWALGVAPDAIQVRENNLDFLVPLGVEQKTGWFFDHRVSRRELRHWVKDARVLDLYSFLGAFGLNAAAAGAASVLAIDSSALAVDAANANAALQKVTDRFTSIKGDVVDVLRELFEAGDRFDVVVVDPPAFVKRKKDLEAGRRHYALVNRLAMRLLTEGGIVLSASCSQAFSRDDLRNTLRQAAPKASSGLHILGSLEQGPDHPVLAAMPETHYLKGFVAQLLK